MRVYKSIFCCFLTSFSFLLLSCFLQPATFKFDFKIFELWALFVNLSMFWFFIFPVTFFKKRYLSNALYLCSHSRRLFSSILSKIIKSFSWKRCYSLLLIWKILNPSDIVTWLSKHVVPMIIVSICKLFVLKRRFAVLGTLAICFVFSSLFSNFVVSYFLHANKSLWIIQIFASNNNHPDHHRFANLKIKQKKNYFLFWCATIFDIRIIALYFDTKFMIHFLFRFNDMHVLSIMKFREIATLLNIDTLKVPSMSFYPDFILILF